MSSRPWYKRYGADFVHGTMGLTLEQKGAYSLCLDLIYDRGGPIPDDARWLAGVCGVSVRKWKTLREKLIAAGKLVERDGFLTNSRAEKEIENAAKTARKHAENGAKGGSKSAENRTALKENNELEEARLDHTRAFQKPDKKEREAGISVGSSDDEPRTEDVPAAEPEPRQHDPPKSIYRPQSEIDVVASQLQQLAGRGGWTYDSVSRSIQPWLSSIGIKGLSAVVLTLQHEARGKRAYEVDRMFQARCAEELKRQKKAQGPPTLPDDQWRAVIRQWVRGSMTDWEWGQFDVDLGPMPGQPGCRAPRHILDEELPEMRETG